MKKKLFWIFGSIVFLIIIVFIFAGNYFYNEGIKRGEKVELYSGDEEAVEVSANPEYQAIIDEAQAWYENQEFETIEQTSYDGLSLKADYLENESSNGQAVILAHGYRGQKEDMSEYVKFYYDQGFSILMPDARGHGESEGDYIGYGWHDRKDYLEWLHILIKEKQANSIMLHGNSMGAALVLMTSGEKLPDEVKGIVADSGYTTVYEELSHQLKHLYHLPPVPLLQVTSVVTKIRAGYTFTEASAIEQVKHNTVPLFIIHGDKDELVPTEMAYELYDAAGGDKELWIVPDAGHTKAYTVATKEFETRLQAFIRKSMPNTN